MPHYEFECTVCEHRDDHEMRMVDVEEAMELPCDPCRNDPDGPGPTRTLHRRILGSFGLGAVKGGGGSPGRFGRARK